MHAIRIRALRSARLIAPVALAFTLFSATGAGADEAPTPADSAETASDSDWRPLDQDTRVWVIRAVAITGGMTAGLAGGLYLMVVEPLMGGSDEPMFKDNAPAMSVFFVLAPTLAVLVLASGLGAWAFTEGILMLGRNLVTAVPIGLVLGMMTGAFIGASGFGFLMAWGYPFGIVDTGILEGFFVITGMGLLAGAGMGAIFGFLPGLLLGPAIRLWVGREPGLLAPMFESDEE
jgi:hypothetical protein